MIVKELIELLKTFDENLKVVTNDPNFSNKFCSILEPELTENKKFVCFPSHTSD